MTQPAGLEALLAHREWVRALSRAIVADPAGADDVEQAAWVTALTRPPASAVNLRSWFARVVRSRALDAARGTSRRTVREEAAARRGAHASAADVATRFETERRVAREVAALPEPLRTTVLLRFHEDLPVREVARRMGVPYETARARLASAMAKLRRALASEDDGGLRAVAWLGLAAKGAAMGSSKYAVAAVAVLLVAGGGLAVGVTCLSGDGKDAAGGESTTAAVDGDAAPSSKTRVVATQPRGRRHANDGDATRDGAIQLDQEIKVTFEDAAVPTVATKPPFPLPERLNGRIVDDEGGASLDGARVLLFVVLADGKLGRGQGDTTGADGAFKNPRPQGWDAPGAHAELFIAKEGYETVRVPVTESEPVVKMRRMTRAPLPGRVVGVARDEQGLPLTGALLVTSEDEIRNNAAQYVIADAGGAFVLEGVPPGWKIFRMLGGKDAQAIVPEGGETRIELVVKSDPRSDEERLLGTDSSREGYGKTPIVRDAEGRAPPPREVVISGLPEMPGTAVRLGSAALVPRIYWRFEAKNGEARFPVVAAGEWKVTVVEPGKPAVSMPLRVEAGDGPVRAAFVAK